MKLPVQSKRVAASAAQFDSRKGNHNALIFFLLIPPLGLLARGVIPLLTKKSEIETSYNQEQRAGCYEGRAAGGVLP